MKKNTIKVNLLICGIVALVVGILYIFIGMYLWDIYLDSWDMVMVVMGVIFECTSFGLFTKHLLPNKKGAFFYGLVLGIIAVIIAVIIKNKKDTYKGNKYEDLERLNKLKENGAITEEEFEVEKAKILK